MNNLKYLLLLFTITSCFSVTASAQKDKQEKPPKERPPVIIVNPDKKPTPEKPKDDRKKPSAEMFYMREDD